MSTTITTSSSQLSKIQDLPEVITPSIPEQPTVAPTQDLIEKSITVQEYSDHMSLSTAQLETVVLMLQVLEQSDGGPAPTE